MRRPSLGIYKTCKEAVAALCRTDGPATPLILLPRSLVGVIEDYVESVEIVEEGFLNGESPDDVIAVGWLAVKTSRAAVLTESPSTYDDFVHDMKRMHRWMLDMQSMTEMV